MEKPRPKLGKCLQYSFDNHLSLVYSFANKCCYFILGTSREPLPFLTRWYTFFPIQHFCGHPYKEKKKIPMHQYYGVFLWKIWVHRDNHIFNHLTLFWIPSLDSLYWCKLQLQSFSQEEGLFPIPAGLGISLICNFIYQ